MVHVDTTFGQVRTKWVDQGIRPPPSAYPDTAAIMVTGVDDEKLAGHALALGAYGYIVKPFTKATLEEKVQKIMQKLAATA